MISRLVARLRRPSRTRVETLTIDGLASELLESAPCSASLCFRFADRTLRLRSNDPDLLQIAEDFYRQWLVSEGSECTDIFLLQTNTQDFGLSLRDYSHYPGKAGTKQAFVDLPDGRIIRDLRTGVTFLLSDRYLICCGECLSNRDRIRAFVNSQLAESYVEDDWLYCHAAGVTANGRGIAISGRARSGKSTLALHLMRHAVDFVSNDGLLIKSETEGARMIGFPKPPMVNPGTVMLNPDLRASLGNGPELEMRSMDAEDLWKLKGPQLVDIAGIWGTQRWHLNAPLTALLVLNWSLGETEPTRTTRVNLHQRPDLISEVAKTRRYFLHKTNDRNHDQAIRPDLGNLADIPVFETTGRVDFDRLIDYCLDHLDVERNRSDS